jgi:hypothetical protein
MYVAIPMSDSLDDIFRTVHITHAKSGAKVLENVESVTTFRAMIEWKDSAVP